MRATTARIRPAEPRDAADLVALIAALADWRICRVTGEALEKLGR